MTATMRNLARKFPPIAVLLFGSALSVEGATLKCNSTEDLRSALIDVQPGDEIVLAPGTYFAEDGVPGTASHFPALVDGEANSRITLRSEVTDPPSERALLMGNDAGWGTVLRVFGDYWTVKNLRVTNGQKGIIFDGADYGEIINCEVYGIGYEAIHIRDGSDYCLIDGCRVYNTGIRKNGFGEAIYVGTDRGTWGRYDPYVWYTTIRNCTIGPNIAAEAFDIKEGTKETIIEHNTVDATGISGANYADSFIDLKGTRVYIRYNTFFRNNAAKLQKGIAVIFRGTELSAYEHSVHDNEFHLDGISNIKLVDSYSGSRDVYAWNNIRIPSSANDDDYARIVTSVCCPPWYTPPVGGPGVCTAPYNLLYSDVSNSSATLSWTGGESPSNYTYDIRVREYDTDTPAGEGWVNYTGLMDTTLELSELAPDTIHSWQVTKICGSDVSAPASGADFLTYNGNDGPTPSPGAHQIYSDGLVGFWSDYSWGGTFDLLSREDIRIGGHSIKAEYGAYGGLNLKHSSGGVDGSDLGAIRFWAKGALGNGAGDPTIQLRVNSAEYEFEIRNDIWQIYQIPLSEVGSPSTINAVVLQSRQSEDTVAFYDMIELLAADPPTQEPSQAPSDSAVPTSRPLPGPSLLPSAVPTNPPQVPSTVSPTDLPTSAEPTVAPTVSPSSSPTLSPTSAPTPTLSPPPTPECICPTPSTPAPVSTSSPVTSPTPVPTDTFTIYHDGALAPGWDTHHYKGSFDMASSDEAFTGTVSLRADFNGWGAVNLKTPSPGVLLSSLGSGASSSTVNVEFRVLCAGTSSHMLRVRVNGKIEDIAVSGSSWEHISLPLSDFQNPSDVFQIEIQRAMSGSATIYFDKIQLVHGVFQ